MLARYIFVIMQYFFLRQLIENFDEKSSPITKEEEEEIFSFLEKDPNDQKAIQRLIMANFPYIFNILYRYRGSSFLQDDIISVGVIAILKALEKYDMSKKMKFSSYAIWYIKYEIRLYIANNKYHVRYPLNFLQKASQIREVERKIKKKTGNEFVTKEEIQKFLGGYVKYSNYYIVGSEISFNEQDKGSYCEALTFDENSTPEKIYERKELSKDIFETIETVLDNRELLIIRMRYALGDFEKKHTLKEIADECNLSKEMIRRIQRNVLKKIREALDL